MTRPGEAARMDVVVVSFNAREHLRACLASVEPEAEGAVVVVDGSSTDGSAEMVEAEHPLVRLVRSANLGYGALANRGVAETGAGLVLLLNGDTVLRPGAVRALGAYLDAFPRAGLAGPRLLNPDGSLQPSCFPFLTPLQILLTMTPLNELVGSVPGLRERHLPTSSHDAAGPVPWLKGAALAIRRVAFEDVDGFDESYFMYFEELDLAYRLRAAGWETHFTPAVAVVHHGGASTSQQPGPMAEQLYDSLLRFAARHYSRRRLAGVRLALAAVLAGKLVQGGVRLLGADGSRRAEVEASLRALRRTLAGP